MEQPKPQDDEQPEANLPDDSPSFEDLLLLVFNGPMCFEGLDDEVSDQSEEDTEKFGLT